MALTRHAKREFDGPTVALLSYFLGDGRSVGDPFLTPLSHRQACWHYRWGVWSVTCWREEECISPVTSHNGGAEGSLGTITYPQSHPVPQNHCALLGASASQSGIAISNTELSANVAAKLNLWTWLTGGAIANCLKCEYWDLRHNVSTANVELPAMTKLSPSAKRCIWSRRCRGRL